MYYSATVAELTTAQKSDLLKAAIKYAERGWYVFPVRPGGKEPLTPNGFKDATVDPAIIRSWWDRTKWPTANLGSPCGKSHLVVIDLDEKHDGIYNWQELCGKLGIENNTVVSLTGGGGQHWFYLAPAGVDLKNSVGVLAPGVDVRANGGYVVLPPSIHPNGCQYHWELSSNLDSCHLQPLPPILVELLQQKKSQNHKLASEDVIAEGQRNAYLASLAGSMRRRGMSQESIESALLSENDARCSPPLERDEVIQIAQSISRYEPELSSVKDKTGSFHVTDLGNAKTLVELYGKDLRYCHPFGSWFLWDGIRWQEDSSEKIRQHAHRTITNIIKQASDIEDYRLRDERFKRGLVSQSHSRINGMLGEAQSLIPVSPDKFDQNGWLLNCQNGIIDLGIGELQDHRREDFHSKLSPAVFNSDASCAKWETFLNEIMLGNKELIKFLQKTVGYSLTGDTSEQCIFILYGTGANGKSTFLNTIMKLLGDYSAQTPTETLMVKRENGIPSDLARLAGVRLVAAAETDEGRRLSESLVKQLTGCDRIVARHLYGRWFEYDPVFKVFLSTNHKPVIRGTDHAIWRRIRLIPFDYTVPKDQQDKNLMDKLAEELPGILRWAVEGCLMWQEEGLEPPEEVKQATASYRQEMDVLGSFLDECCVINEECQALASDLFKDYRKWCDDSGEKSMTATLFGRLLIERGFARHQETTGRRRTVYLGLGIKDTIE